MDSSFCYYRRKRDYTPMEGIDGRSARRYALPMAIAIIALAALIITVLTVSDDSDAASSYDTYKNVKIDGVEYSLDISGGWVATAVACDFSRTDVVIQDEIEDEHGKKFRVNKCEIVFNNRYMVEHITFGKYVLQIDTDMMGRCQFLKTITIRGNSGLSKMSGLSDIATLESIDVSLENMSYTSIDGVLFSKLTDELYVYPSGKTSNIFEIPMTMVSMYDDCGLKNNKHLQKITGSSLVYSTKDGVLYNPAFTRIIVCPAGLSGDKFTIPEGVTDADFPVYTNVKEIVVPTTFAATDMEWGFAAGVLKIPKEALPAGITAAYSIVFEETKEAPSAVKKVAEDNRIYRIDIGGQAEFGSPIVMTMYEVRYRASNMHVYNVAEDGSTTDVNVLERAKTGAKVETTLPGYYTYKFNNSTAIENAEIIAVAIAAFGTVAAVIAALGGIGRRS